MDVDVDVDVEVPQFVNMMIAMMTGSRKHSQTRSTCHLLISQYIHTRCCTSQYDTSVLVHAIRSGDDRMCRCLIDGGLHLGSNNVRQRTR